MKSCMCGCIISVIIISSNAYASSDSNEKLDKKLIGLYELALQIKGYSTQRSTLRDLARTSIKQKKYHTAYKIAQSIDGSSTKRHILKKLAISAAKEGDVDFAIMVANSIKGDFTRDATIKKIIALR